LCFSRTIYLYNKKFDLLFIVDPIWLVWHTYISHSLTHSLTQSLTHSLTHWPVHNIPDAPTKRYFFYKKITQKKLKNLTVSNGLFFFLSYATNILFRVCSFGVIRFRISDPRSLRSCGIKKADDSTLVCNGLIGSFDVPWSVWFWINVPDPDHTKGMHL